MGKWADGGLSYAQRLFNAFGKMLMNVPDAELKFILTPKIY